MRIRINAIVAGRSVVLLVDQGADDQWGGAMPVSRRCGSRE